MEILQNEAQDISENATQDLLNMSTLRMILYELYGSTPLLHTKNMYYKPAIVCNTAKP